jgi:predicted nucleic acid-binding protein
MNYLLDTNVIADLLRHKTGATKRVERHIQEGDTLHLCQPVYYEAWRGLLKAGATGKIRTLETKFRPIFQWVTLTDEDWLQAARFWAAAVSKGKQLVAHLTQSLAIGFAWGSKPQASWFGNP